MQIALTNIEITRLVRAVGNVRGTMDKVPGRINLRMDEAVMAVKDQFYNFSRNLPDIQKDHIAVDDKGNFKQTMDPLGRMVYVFKSDEDERAYLEVTEEKHTFNIKGLTESDMEKIVTSDDKIATHYEHFKHLKLITKGHQNPPEDISNNEPKTDEEE